MGLPAWIPSEEELKKIEDLAAQGLTQEQIAYCIGRHPDTISHKKHECEQLGQAIKRGKARGLQRVTDALLRNVDLGSVPAQIFYLKAQGGWKDSQPVIVDNKSFLESIKSQLVSSEKLDEE